MELESAQHASGFDGGKAQYSVAGRVRRQIVEHDSDALGVRKVNVGEFAHAGGEVNGGAAVGDLDLAPGPMRVEEDQQFDRSVVLILAVGAFDLGQLGRDRRANLADELGRVLIETDNWAPGIALRRCRGLVERWSIHDGVRLARN